MDDHALIRQGLKQLIETQTDMEVCAEAATYAAAVKAAEKHRPDVAIVDLTLGESSGLELIKALVSHRPELLVLVLSMHDEAFYAERAMRAGAKGYVMKGGALQDVLMALRQVMDGKIYLSSDMTAKLLQRVAGGPKAAGESPTSSLTDRELQVFEMIGEGMGVGEIARRLHLSVKTIETHCAHIKQKLDIRDAAGLRQYASHWMRGRGPAL